MIPGIVNTLDDFTVPTFPVCRGKTVNWKKINSKSIIVMGWFPWLRSQINDIGAF
jgi:hypothetical protein